MATYKVIQDIEAEDKLVGPLTLRQFIYAAISALLLYISFLSATKGAAFLLLVLVPPALLIGFLAIPWHGDQPTEIWALAKLRFLLKPRKRIWDQSGAKELVTITAPKVVERVFTNGLSQHEVRSRLHALANTIDSRGWAVKNVNVNLNAGTGAGYSSSDRLVDASSLPQEVSSLELSPADDMLDTSANPIAQNFDSMMNTAATKHRQQLVQQLQQPSQTQAAPATQQASGQQPADYWFMHQAAQQVPGQATFQSSTVVAPGVGATTDASAPVAATPTAEEEALVAQLKAASSQQAVADDHLKHIKTPEQLAQDAREKAAALAREAAEKAQKAQVTSDRQAAIMNLASNDDLDIATLARQAKKKESDDGEVVISLR